MANSDLHADWFFQSIYSPQELVEVLPSIRTIQKTPPQMLFDWKKLSVEGFELQYTFGRITMLVQASMTLRDNGTLISMRRPRFFTLSGFLIAGVLTSFALAVMVWACWPAIERDSWVIMIPVVAMLIMGSITVGILGGTFLWGRASLKPVLCRTLKAELLDPNTIRQF